MLRRLAAGSSAIALVLLLVGPAAPGVVLATARTCTGWTSEYVAPPTIRVYRTVGPAKGSVQVVPFRQYVTTVLAAEFGPAAPIEALRAGAVAVKDYGWFYTRAWRGNSAPRGGCYDVRDDAWDQVYWPERYHPEPRDAQAVLDTWKVSVRKHGSFLLTGYGPGTRGAACGTDADGWRLYQASAYRCALDGMLYPEILRTYYGPGFHIVVPGIPDPSGDGLGEIGIAVSGAAPVTAASTLPGASPSPSPASPSGFYDLVWSQGPQAPWRPAAVPPGTSLDPVTTLGWAFADVNHDGRADVLRLERLGTAGYRITVALSDGDGRFAPAATWWSNVGSGPDLGQDAAVRLIAGDFDGAGIDEAGILVSAAGTPPIAGPGRTTVTAAVVPRARLYVLRPETGTAFSAPRLAWSGALDVSRVQAFAADATGDGRADLVVASDLFPPDLSTPATAATAVGPDGTELPVGIRFLVAPALPDGSFGALQGWSDVTDTTRLQAQLVVEDVNRDGRSDVVALEPAGAAGSRLVGLVSDGSRFSSVTLWASDAFRASASRIAAADLNGDGRGDLVILYDAGSGTRLYQFLSTGSAFRPGVRVLDPTLDWSQVQPF